MTSANDWRLTNQASYLSGVTLVRKAWVRSRADWDHDHCAFCWAKFADVDASDVLREGYATRDDYYWVCPKCFADFREQFGWQVIGE